jgi:hypothetical protein
MTIDGSVLRRSPDGGTMLDNVAAVALAKAKVLALITASLAAGGVGGAVALSHAAPSSHLVRDVAATSSVEDPETDEATDPETADATDPETDEATDPETDEATDPETGEAGDYTLPDCPADVKNHGAYVSSVAKGAPKGKDANHGSYVSEAAKSDCGKTAGDGAADPETDEATDPETDEAQDPETNEATDPETGDATDTETESASVKTAKAKDHGHGASSWSGNGHGKNNG